MNANSLRVMRAYRSMLKLQLNWIVSRWDWYDQIPEVRASFEDALKGEEPGSAKAEAFLASVEHDLATYKHPDPYTFPYYEGGTKYQRNTPPPEFVLHGKMEDYH